MAEKSGKKRKKAAKPNWKKIETEYITTDISQRKLAEKYGVSYNTIKNKSAVGGWVEKKHEHHRKVTAAARDAIAGAQVQDLVDLADCVDKHIELMKKVYEDEEQFKRHLVEIEDDDGKTVEERVFQKYDTKAMRDCTLQLEKLVNIFRDVHELPNQQQREAQRIASEKLELEKTKAAADPEQQKIEVVFDGGEVEEWSE